MHLYDGKENDFIFGRTRSMLLNQTWLVPNLFSSSSADELSIRFYIAAANGSVVSTETGLNKYPFVPGKHLVECPLEQMPEKILYYMENEKEWRVLSRNMLSLITKDLTF